jgi:hypothetical protein
MKISKALVAFTLSFSFPVASSAGCGPCEYRDGLTGQCLPKGGCIVEQLNPVTQVQKVITLATAVASGDTAAIKQSLGNVLITSPNCLGCQSVVHNVLPNLSDVQINAAVGEGFLVYLATGDPVLVTIDAATNIASQQNVRNQQPQLPDPSRSSATKRATRSYSATATCLVKKKGDSYVYAAWKAPAIFTGAGGTKFQYPDIDLLAGDILTITAPICPSWNDSKQGQESITSAKFKFEAVSSLTGKPEAIKWFAYGRNQ